MPSYMAPTGGAPEPLVDFGGDVGGDDEFVDFGAEPPTDEVERPVYPEGGPLQDDEETQIGVNIKALRNGGVTEGAYSGGGEAPIDTTDSGWESSVYSKETEPAPSSGRGASSVLGRARGGSIGGPKKPPEPVKPMATPTAPMQLFGDDGAGDADGLPGGMSDLSDFDNGGEGPPTEEVPSAVLEDLGQLYNASMSVPEPAPLPELFSGNETPTEPAGHSALSRTPPPVPKAPPPRYESSTPAPAKSKAELPRTPPPARPMVYREEDDEEVEIGEGGGWLLLIGGFIALIAVAGVIAAAVVATNRSSITGGDLPVEVVAPEPPALTVEADPAQEPSEVDAADSDVSPDAATDTDAAPEDSDSPAAPVEDPANAQTPPKNSTTTAVKPTPKVEPKVTPVTKPPPVEEKVPAGMGTIKIRANKRVIVQVNGNLLDFAPVDLPFAAGNHTVGAMLPGRPDSLQEKPIKLRKGKTVTVDFDF